MTTEQRHKYIEDILRPRLSDYRLEHSINVADEAVRLAKKYGGDVERAELAGLLHDVMKEAPQEEQLQYIHALIKKPDDILLASHKLWHSAAGAGYVRSVLKIKDTDLLNAIRYHTTARAGMSLLEKIVYLADYTGAERDYNGVDTMRRLVNKSLEQAMSFALTFSIMDLAEKGKPIHPDTLAAYNEIVISGGTHKK